MDVVIEDNKLRQLLREAVIDVIEEKKNMFYDIFIEAMEDIALANAIEQGENTKSVSRAKIFNILENPE